MERGALSERMLWVYFAAVVVALSYVAMKPSVDHVLYGPTSSIGGERDRALVASDATATAPSGTEAETSASPALEDGLPAEGNRADASNTDLALAEDRDGASSASLETNAEVDGDLGVIPSGFELTSTGSRSNSIEADNAGNIEVRKSVYLGGAAIGTIPVTIDPNAQLLLNSRDIRNLLSNQAGIGRRLNTLPEDGLVSFQRLRSSGIDLRYNPTGDRIVLRLT